MADPLASAVDHTDPLALAVDASDPLASTTDALAKEPANAPNSGGAPPAPAAVPTQLVSGWRRRSIARKSGLVSTGAPAADELKVAVNKRRLSMTMQNKFKEVENDVEEEQEEIEVAEGATKAVPQPDGGDSILTEIRIPKKGGRGERTLTLREQLLLRSLMRDPQERNEDDLSLIVRATSDIKFFQDLSEQQHSEVCVGLTHEVVPEGKTIFTQGDEGSIFYIVYRGSCKMYVNDAKLNWRRTCVATQNEGGSFGELALLSDGGTRSATAVADKTSILLKIEREEYTRTLMKLHHADLKLMKNYLRSIFLFEGSTAEELNRLASCLTRRRCARNTAIIRQGTTSDALFFVLRGTCRVIKKCTVPRDQRPLLETSPDAKLSPRYVERTPKRPSMPHERPPPPLPSESLKLIVRDDEDEAGVNSSFTKGSKKSFTRKSTKFAFKSVMLSQHRKRVDNDSDDGDQADTEEMLLEIAHLGPHQYFGELSLLLRQPHTASVVSNDPVELLVLKRQDFALHMESLCSNLMIKYAKRYHVDNIFEDKDTRGICRAIARGYQWNSYKARVLSDAVAGEVLEGHQHDALNPTILDAANQGLNGSLLFNGPPRVRMPSVAPASERSQPESSFERGSPASRSPRLPALKASPRVPVKPKGSPRSYGRSSGGRTRVGYSMRGAGILGSIEQQRRLEAAGPPLSSTIARTVPNSGELGEDVHAPAPAALEPSPGITMLVEPQTPITLDGGYSVGALDIV